MNTGPNELPYRKCVGIMLMNREGKVFVGYRMKPKASTGWQMPQGGIDDGETPKDAALRELMEEVGTNNVEIIAESKDWLHYDLPDHIVGDTWKGRYRGQTQKWFAMKFLGQDDEIDLNHHHKPEFSKFKWVDLPVLPSLIVAFKRPVYEQLVDEFSTLPNQIQSK